MSRLFMVFLVFALMRLIGNSLLITISISYSNQLIETSPKKLSFFCIHLEFDIEIHLVLNLINSIVEMINHIPIANFIGF